MGGAPRQLEIQTVSMLDKGTVSFRENIHLSPPLATVTVYTVGSHYRLCTLVSLHTSGQL